MPKIKIGDRVKVADDAQFDVAEHIGKTGVVLRHAPVDLVLVEIDDDWGAVWFHPEELEALP